MANPWEALGQLFEDLGSVLLALLLFLLHWSLVIAWLAWALAGINWPRTWPLLARGGWVPLALLAVIAAVAWAALFPGGGRWNFWWQLGVVALVVGLTFFCAWLQRIFGWEPAEIDLEPAAEAGGHEHGH